MTINSASLDRATLVGLIAAAMLPFLALDPAPAHAGTTACAAQAAAVRSAALTAEPKAASRALKLAQVAEKICAAGNSHEAGRKLAQAQRLLDTGVQLATNR